MGRPITVSVPHKLCKSEESRLAEVGTNMLDEIELAHVIDVFRKVLRQSQLHAAGSVLLTDFLPPGVCATPVAAGGADAPNGAPACQETLIDEELNQGRNGLYAKSLECMESLLLTRVLEHTRGNQSLAARLLNISRSSLRNKLQQLHITISQVAGIEEEPVEEDVTQQDSILRLRTGSD